VARAPEDEHEEKLTDRAPIIASRSTMARHSAASAARASCVTMQRPRYFAMARIS
jgi:hypothetical protein